MKQPVVPLTPSMIAALANLRRTTIALSKKGRKAGQPSGQVRSTSASTSKSTFAHREEDGGLRRAMNDPPEGGGFGRKKRAE